MSKSLGNSPDLLQLIDESGADAIRFSVMISSPAGNDLLFDEGQIEQGKFFINKMWNAMKLVKGWESRIDASVDDSNVAFAINWMEQRIAEVSKELDELLKDFRLSEGLKTLYSLIWNDFCSWYLEWVKPAQDQPTSKNVYDRTVAIYEQLLQLLHPYLPFVTEDIYHTLRERAHGDDLVEKQLPTAATPDAEILKQGALLKEVITAIRDTRNKNLIKPKETIKLHIDTGNKGFYEKIGSILERQVNAESLNYTAEAKAGAVAIVVQTDKMYIEAEMANKDSGAQKEQMQKDLEYLRGFLQSVDKKLSNERFVQNAKAEILDAERRKQADALAKIKAIEESLSLL
jgi:valyl-tRNA synthetase